MRNTIFKYFTEYDDGLYKLSEYYYEEPDVLLEDITLYKKVQNGVNLSIKRDSHYTMAAGMINLRNDVLTAMSECERIEKDAWRVMELFPDLFKNKSEV